MAGFNLLLVLAAGLIVFTLTKIISALNDPLNKIPNAHFSVPFSRLWLVWNRARGTEVTTTYEVHKRLGPIVRIGPKELSINCIENGVQVVYSTNWDKAEMYGNFVNYGHPPLFAILEGKSHAERKRIYSHVYSKSTIDNSVELKNILRKYGAILQQRLSIWAAERKMINALPISEAYSMDVVTAYIYGSANATQWLADDEAASFYLPAFQTVLEPYVFFLFSELPGLLELAGRVGINLIPQKVLSALDTVHPYVHNLTAKAVDSLQDAISDEVPVVSAIQHMQGKLIESKIPEDQRLDLLASDVLDQIHAAHEATGIVLTFVMWELTKAPNVQSELRKELQNLSASGKSPVQSELLEYIVLETSRLFPAAFGPFPRSAPHGAKVAGFDIPVGTIVSASPYSLGRNTEVFPDPDRWSPRRWSNATKEQRKMMKKWVWIFTSGSRMCIGEHLAMLVMKSFLVEIYTNHRTVLVKESNMKQLETFIALPTDASLFLRLEAA